VAAGPVEDPLTRRGKVNHFGNIRRMITDPLDILCDEQQVRGAGDFLRILHHEGQQGPENTVIEIIDRLIAPAAL
jgi:hypothetical protein